MKIKVLVFGLLSYIVVYSQANELISTNISINKFIDGTLLTSSKNNNSKSTLAILIAGSGPTDRNGNQNFLKNNSIKKLAEALTKQGIATFRYDKRIVKQIRRGYVDKNIKFDDFITDAESVIGYFISLKQFDKIYIVGHSQGSLVGMIAAKNKADGFVSIAGAGHSIDRVIIEQIKNTAPMFTQDAVRVFNILKEGKTTTDYPEALESVFKIENQPFMANWMQYDPKKNIQDLDIPILIINGSKDLQVSINEATLLNESAKNSSLKIIDNMNHIMFLIEGGNLENSKSYNESFRSISTELVDEIIAFMK